MKVEPIVSAKDIKSIKRLLSNRPRDRLLFICGCNSGLRVQDLLALKIGDVKYTNIGDRIVIREKKTGKENVFMINKEIKVALDEYLKTIEARDEHFLFKSRKGKNEPLPHMP
ncbi:site-specific recombinase [Solidesulfovibrio fructosivorans JJ]]|uniref:Site-specific recombinase n=1 Tax=Solidesulfovibrio fructosivorans JJ] TaxID=596151 RepID=E1JT74_SOLFR|nr:site-specific recombinase [Solidesulfovibrio fructosivorans JJ]]